MIVGYVWGAQPGYAKSGRSRHPPGGACSSGRAAGQPYVVSVQGRAAAVGTRPEEVKIFLLMAARMRRAPSSKFSLPLSRRKSSPWRGTSTRRCPRETSRRAAGSFCHNSSFVWCIVGGKRKLPVLDCQGKSQARKSTEWDVSTMAAPQLSNVLCGLAAAWQATKIPCAHLFFAVAKLNKYGSYSQASHTSGSCCSGEAGGRGYSS